MRKGTVITLGLLMGSILLAAVAQFAQVTQVGHTGVLVKDQQGVVGSTCASEGLVGVLVGLVQHTPTPSLLRHEALGKCPV